jgi:hypothetical protein
MGKLKQELGWREELCNELSMARSSSTAMVTLPRWKRHALPLLTARDGTSGSRRCARARWSLAREQLGGVGLVATNLAGEAKLDGGSGKKRRKERWPARRDKGDGEASGRPAPACEASRRSSYVLARVRAVKSITAAHRRSCCVAPGCRVL